MDGGRTVVSGWLARLGSPEAWSPVDRALLVALIMMPMSGLFALFTHYRSGWPFLAPNLDSDVVAQVARNARWIVTGWCVLAVGCAALRRVRPFARSPAYVAVAYYGITIASFAFVTDPFRTHGGFALLGGAIVGMLLFQRRVLLVGIACFAGAIATIGGLTAIDVLPYRALIDMPANEPAGTWAFRMALPSVFLLVFLLVLCDAIITAWRKREAQLAHLSRTDALTGLLNRRRFIELVAHEQRQARRYDRPLAVLMVDVDHFKQFNDEHGHLVGDAVLIEVARALETAVRDADVVARLGGEEFVVMLPNTDCAGAREVAQRCLLQIRGASVLATTGRLSVTASLGVAAFAGAAAPDVDDLLRIADAAMYDAKRAGRNRVAEAPAPIASLASA